MPAFDPVRDAVLNSPTVATQPGSSSPYPHTHSSSPSASPPLGRRATHLSVLLNSDEHIVPSAPSSSSSFMQSPTHIDPPQLKERLSSTPALRRAKNINIEIAQQPPSPPPVPVPPQPEKIPYAPKNRISRPATMLIPLSNSERETLRRFRGKGTQRLAKRKRASSEEDYFQPPLKRQATDKDKVVAHYNARPEVGLRQRQDSPIIGLKNFNNWIKSVLITRFAHPALSGRSTSSGKGPRLSGRVLEMGMGKGGDLTKWSKAKVKELVGADIADVSVRQAQSRWEALKGARFDAKFAAIDCYTERLTSAFHPDVFKQPFDVVSMQFCMHYAFESEQKVRCMLRNVTEWLRPGGVFIGTIPNAEQLLERLDAIPEGSDLSFGNSVYTIRFEKRTPRPIYGHKYFFYLQDAVDNVPEYIVDWDNFVQVASEFGLKKVYRKEFHQVFSEHQSHPEFGPLMVRMKVQNENGESAMDEDQWEAANVYIAFAFEKVLK